MTKFLINTSIFKKNNVNIWYRQIFELNFDKKSWNIKWKSSKYLRYHSIAIDFLTHISVGFILRIAKATAPDIEDFC